MKTKRDYKRDYQSHKDRAKQGGIEFLLTFEEWFRIWIDSGHLHERGRMRGQYQMARFGDTGPYAVWNVKIITGYENKLEAISRRDISAFFSQLNKGRLRSEQAKRKTSEALKGVPKSEEHKRNLSISKMGKPIYKARGRRSPRGPQTEEHKRKRLEGYLKAVEVRKTKAEKKPDFVSKFTDEHRRKIGQSVKLTHQQKKMLVIV